MGLKEGLDNASQKVKTRIFTSEASQIFSKRNDWYQFYSEQPLLYADPKITTIAASLAAIEVFSVSDKFKKKHQKQQKDSSKKSL